MKFNFIVIEWKKCGGYLIDSLEPTEGVIDKGNDEFHINQWGILY